MLYGLYLSANGLALNQYRQDVIANNLANADTPGFKRSDAVFKQRLQESKASLAGARFAPENLRASTGGAFASQSFVDFSQGSIRPTSEPLDISLNGPGMLTVRDGGQTTYSRDGRLTVAGGKLVRITDAKPVLGDDGHEIDVGSASPRELRIDTDGNIWRGPVQLGQIGIVEFAGDRQDMLTPAGGNLYRSTAQPEAAKKTSVVSQAVEQSGVNPANELVEMIKSSRHFELNAQMISMQDASLGRLIDLARV